MEHPLNNPLPSWSWQEIQSVYTQYGLELQEYHRIYSLYRQALRCRGLNYYASYFADSYKRDVQKLDLKVRQLDVEIARRNSLIGVMG